MALALNNLQYAIKQRNQTNQTRSVFKQTKSGLNSEYSFFLIGYITKAKEPSFP